MTKLQTKVWLVTGSNTGLGRDIAKAVLEAGDLLVATARDTAQLADLEQAYGDRVRLFTLDVTDEQAAQNAVEVAVHAFGRLDVVVNNAGYGHIVPFEQTTPEDFRAQVETNFFGVVNVTRAALPVLRSQRSGHIMQVSSLGGRIGNAGLTAYQSAKWAVGGFSEALAQEVTPFGVKVTVLEPGGMRTNWGSRAGSARPALLADYQASVGALLDLVEPYVGKENSDPKTVADIVVELASHSNPPMHLLLGSDAVQYAGAAEAARAAVDERWRPVSKAADFGATTKLPAFPAN